MNSELICLPSIYFTIYIAFHFISLPFFPFSCYSLFPVFSPRGVLFLKLSAAIPSANFSILSGVVVQAPILACVISFSRPACVCVSGGEDEGKDSQFLRAYKFCMAVFERKVLA